MSETKYYTPNITEFCEGFEYEYSYDKGEWIKEKFSVSCGDTDSMAGDWYEFAPSCPRTECRVKYLDREDIESLGFSELTKEQKDEHSTIMIGGGSFIRIDDDGNIKTTIIIQYLFPVISIHLLDEKSLRGYNKPFVCFKGRIKNKSELKKLMTQLGINAV